MWFVVDEVKRGVEILVESVAQNYLSEITAAKGGRYSPPSKMGTRAGANSESGDGGELPSKFRGSPPTQIPSLQVIVPIEVTRKSASDWGSWGTPGGYPCCTRAMRARPAQDVCGPLSTLRVRRKEIPKIPKIPNPTASCCIKLAELLSLGIFRHEIPKDPHYCDWSSARR
jgi:hypothetical protein